jgi:signal transduction histidine kinase
VKSRLGRANFRSLRWRIATFYALLLLCVVGMVAIVLTFELRAILLDEARAKIDRVADDISQTVEGNSVLSAIGEGLPVVQQLATTGALDHWAGPTTFVEVDTATGYPVGKSTNMGSATLEPVAVQSATAIEYHTEDRPQLGSILVRDEIVHAQGIALIVAVGESLGIYDETIARIRVLLVLVVALSALVVVAGSFGIASSAIEPINRLIAAMGKTRSDRMNERLGWSGRGDEIGSLAQSFDAMLDRLEDGFARERQFISDASHELKTPLTVINANAQMLERWADRDPEIRMESLRAISQESAALAAMVNGMLLLAKAESGDDIPREHIALERPLADAIRATLPRAQEKGLALVSRVGSGDETLVYGDINLLRQLFTNLIDNAIKFTERGSVEVDLSHAGGRAVVSVSDTGIGIDDEALERIFDRFFRADASRDRTIPGTGLGLAIVRSIARVHEGTVWAEKRPEGGTRFLVSLPMSSEPTLTPAS